MLKTGIQKQLVFHFEKLNERIQDCYLVNSAVAVTHVTHGRQKNATDRVPRRAFDTIRFDRGVSGRDIDFRNATFSGVPLSFLLLPRPPRPSSALL